MLINNKAKELEKKEFKDEKELEIVEKMKWTYHKKNPKNSAKEEGKDRKKDD